MTDEEFEFAMDELQKKMDAQMGETLTLARSMCTPEQYERIVALIKGQNR